ncbi:MAG: hypothetical protein RSB20_00695 [Clostridia bacterium]
MWTFIKFILSVLLIIFIGGVILQACGVIDWQIFRWLFELGAKI